MGKMCIRDRHIAAQIRIYLPAGRLAVEMLSLIHI